MKAEEGCNLAVAFANCFSLKKKEKNEITLQTN
jgi:hypothetical protein